MSDSIHDEHESEAGDSALKIGDLKDPNVLKIYQTGELTVVTLVPSGMLGVLTSLRSKVQKIELYNPSVDVREVLHMTRLESLFEIKEVAF